ncbi:MAG: hypothetical protein JO319_18580 [Acidobacteriaceae bacterium]|nr:hypothetical protein [Acidobacteriaceae bacterium]
MRPLRISFEASCRALITLCGVFLFAHTPAAATVNGQMQVLSGPVKSTHQAVDLSDVVAWLEPSKDVVTQPIETGRVRLLQKNKTFSPHVLAIPVGTTVDFPNADPIFHSAFSNYDGQLFDLSLYPPGTTKSVRFHRPGIVRVFCNIHPTMSAVIVVLDTPYFTKAKQDGSYQITNVPPGAYELEVFDERATGKPAQELRINVRNSSAEVTAPTVRVSEQGYAPLRHKNKYGLDYPPDEDAADYNGVPK